MPHTPRIKSPEEIRLRQVFLPEHAREICLVLTMLRQQRFGVDDPSFEFSVYDEEENAIKMDGSTQVFWNVFPDGRWLSLPRLDGVVIPKSLIRTIGDPPYWRERREKFVSIMAKFCPFYIPTNAAITGDKYRLSYRDDFYQARGKKIADFRFLPTSSGIFEP